ncbi:MAG: tRNA (adenosine(37)-N6)-dimethylallyltransferase MiaA [Cyclobacteriaceae bacterium]
MNKVLIVIGGPTAVGKTTLAIEVARHFKTEILSADSRQFYREMNIGTAKPNSAERSLVRHHFIDNLSIFDQYDVGMYEKEALNTLKKLFEEKDVAVLVGGSGLFIQAVTDGFDEIPKPAPEIRASINKLFEEEGIEVLQARLNELDPTYYSQVDQKNPARLIRALEVIESSGKPFSSFHTRKPNKRDFDIICIALDVDRAELYARIDLRMDQMIKGGLFDEAEKLLPHADLNALQTVGYKEIFGYLNKEYDKSEAIRLLKRNSRRYAKRQLTWFKKGQRFDWFSPQELYQIIDHINLKIKALHA